MFSTVPKALLHVPSSAAEPSGEARVGEVYSRDRSNKEGHLAQRTGADLNLKGFWGVVGGFMALGGRTRSCFMV